MTAHFHLMAKPSSFHCNIQCEYCFYLEKEAQFGITAPFYVERNAQKLRTKITLILTQAIGWNLRGKGRTDAFRLGFLQASGRISATICQRQADH